MSKKALLAIENLLPSLITLYIITYIIAASIPMLRVLGVGLALAGVPPESILPAPPELPYLTDVIQSWLAPSGILLVFGVLVKVLRAMDTIKVNSRDVEKMHKKIDKLGQTVDNLSIGHGVQDATLALLEARQKDTTESMHKLVKCIECMTDKPVWLHQEPS